MRQIRRGFQWPINPGIIMQGNACGIIRRGVNGKIRPVFIVLVTKKKAGVIGFEDRLAYARVACIQGSLQEIAQAELGGTAQIFHFFGLGPGG
jgi:hypothetical protein